MAVIGIKSAMRAKHDSIDEIRKITDPVDFMFAALSAHPAVHDSTFIRPRRRPALRQEGRAVGETQGASGGEDRWSPDRRVLRSV